jgi:hypothetical protein
VLADPAEYEARIHALAWFRCGKLRTS